MPPARKRFGQHFLHDRNIVECIIRAIDPRPGDRLLEIGPGYGAITYPLLERCKQMTAVEIDRDLIPQLQKKSETLGELELINADILEFDLDSLPGDDAYRLVGNLPYNISTPLLFHLLESVHRIIDMHFMVQKEVALRIVAGPGDANYGRLSVTLQQRCDCEYLFDVAPTCFRPPPRVNSAVVRMLPLAEPRHDHGDDAVFSSIVQAAFGQRRKTVANSLKSLVKRDLFERCGIDPGLRAENLDIRDYACLSKAISK